MEALEFVGLADRARQSAAVLPLGLKRMLEIARALASAPTLLLLDEPASGLDAVETERLQDLILELRRQGITTLLVEHDMGLTMEVADEIAVLNYGKLIADGPPRAIQKNPEVIAAYLGTDWQDLRGRFQVLGFRFWVRKSPGGTGVSPVRNRLESLFHQ